MTWLEKVTKQINRVFPNSDLTESATEAEVVDFLESAEPVNEVLENSSMLKDMAQQIKDLEAKLETSVTQESIDTLTNSVETVRTDLTSLIETNNTESAKAVSDLKTEMAKELNSVKATSSKKKTAKIVDPPLTGDEGGEEEEDKDSATVNMKDLFQGSIVPGLI